MAASTSHLRPDAAAANTAECYLALQQPVNKEGRISTSTSVHPALSIVLNQFCSP